MLKRLFIDNIRCLTNFELRPGPIAVLVGPNGGGKSTVFDVLLAMQDFLVRGLPINEVVWDSRTRWDSRLVQQVVIDVEHPGGPIYSYSLKAAPRSGPHKMIVEEERLTCDGDLLYRAADGEVRLFDDRATQTPRATFPFDSRRSFLSVLEPRSDNRRMSWFKEWIAEMFLLRMESAQLELGSLEEAVHLDSSGKNFASWYRTLQQESPEIIEQIRKDMEPIIGGLQSLKLERIGPSAKQFFAQCEVKGNSFQLSMVELSQGQRVLLVLYTVLRALGTRATLLAFDEPDNFVAEAEIQPWLSQLRQSIIDAKHTLLVCSHHPQVIDYLAADKAFYLWRDAGGPTRLEEVAVDREKGVSASEWIRSGLSHAGG